MSDIYANLLPPPSLRVGIVPPTTIYNYGKKLEVLKDNECG